MINDTLIGSLVCFKAIFEMKIVPFGSFSWIPSFGQVGFLNVTMKVKVRKEIPHFHFHLVFFMALTLAFARHRYCACIGSMQKVTP